MAENHANSSAPPLSDPQPDAEQIHAVETPPDFLELDLPAGAEVHLTINGRLRSDAPRRKHRIPISESAPRHWRIDDAGLHARSGRLHRKLLDLENYLRAAPLLERLRAGLNKLIPDATPLQSGLFFGALFIYLATRLFHLEDYPIYFFTDEAIHTVLAADFLRDGLRDYNGVLFPTYFKNAALYNLSISVYLQLIPTLLFGKSVFVTRAVSVLVGASGAAAVSLLLKDAFRLQSWWLGTLLLTIIPAWFLHSRTAFETILMVSFYAWCLYFYARYRNGKPRALLWTVFFGALAFYSYSGGQLILLATGAALFLSDLRYHLQHRRQLGFAVLLALVLALPYLRFQFQNPGETGFHLRTLDTYLLTDLPLAEKVRLFFSYYLGGLDPRYWFLPHQDDLVRHLMNGYGHIFWPLLPFMLAGLLRGFLHLRESNYRNLFLVTLATPLGVALVGVGITRNLSFLVPAVVWMALGFEWLLEAPFLQQAAIVVRGGLFAMLAIGGIALTASALTQGPTWSDDYGLGGMQYGAAQVYQAAAEKLESGDYDLIYVTPTWANGADILRRFFLPDELPVFLGNTHAFLERYREEFNPRLLFVLTEPEYEDLLSNDKVADIHVDEILNYPDGSPGFYFVSMRYADGVEEIFAAEQALREQPVTERVVLNDYAFNFQHPRFDMGGPEHIFDDDEFTLARVEWGNPALFSLTFDNPQELSGLTLTTGSMDFDLTVTLTLADGTQETYTESFQGLPSDPTISIRFGDTPRVIREIALRIFNPIGGEAFQIHIRGMQLDP